MRRQFETAIRLTLAAQIRNRFAWILLVAFVPVWYLLAGSMTGHAGTVFKLRATGATLVVDGHNLILVTAGLSAITLITGFVVFAAVRRSLPFDRRLVLSGYRPAALIAAKTNAALVQAIAIGAYAAVVILFYWRPPGLWTIALAFMLGAATYAAFGLLIGVLVRGDLEGFFLIIMISLLDTFFQNPVDNPLANKPILEFLPSYAPTQFAAAGAFHHQVLPGMIALSLAWTAALALLGLVVLRQRMPRPARVTGPGRPRRQAPALSLPTPFTDNHRQTLTGAVAHASGVPVATRVKAVCQQTSAWSRLPPPGQARPAPGTPAVRHRVEGAPAEGVVDALRGYCYDDGGFRPRPGTRQPLPGEPGARPDSSITRCARSAPAGCGRPSSRGRRPAGSPGSASPG